jgi:hypothetical protein
MSIWIIIAVIGQLLLNRPISAQLTSITLNTKNFVSLVAYGLAVDPDDDSLFIVYENPNPIDFLVGKYSSQGTLLWLNRYLSQSSPKVYHGDQQAHFHGGNIWLDSTGDDRKDLFVIAYKTTNGYDSSGYTVWRISGETGEINASTFISDSNSYPAGLVGDQNRNLYFGLTNAAGCALGRLPFDLNQTELSVVSTYNSSTCEMSAIATDGMNLYGAGSIKSVNAGSHLFLVRQPLATFSSVSRLLTVAQVNVPGAAYGMALDIGRGLIYLVGEDNILVSAGRVVCIFDLRSLSYRRKISDGSLNSRDAFYFAALHPSGELYVGGERWISADRQLVGLVKLASGSLSGRAIDTFSVNRAGFMAQFSPNKYDLYIVGKSADRPLLFKFTGE